MQIFNSLTNKIEEFTPINPPHVGMYTCGPTIYDRKHIGNFRTYTLSDILFRTLKFLGYDVTHIMNFTDVGHLTGDNEGDADTGEDRLEKAAKRERKTAWEVAKIYEDLFISDFDKLNLIRPAKFVKATDHIEDQIKLIQKLEANGFTYKIDDGIYFNTIAFEEKTGKKYGELSTLDQIKEGARVEPNPQKINPRDFALWKFSPKNEKRDMEWQSPWGIGFPGWHIECSAMSMKYLGETFDLHVGGIDLRSTHHPNEIAQSEGATGKQFVKYWVHGAFILIDGKRMSTSLGNNYNLSDIEAKGFDLISLRYLYFSTHYKQTLNFTFDALSAAQTALNKLRSQVQSLRGESERNMLSPEKEQKVDNFRQDFMNAVGDDLNMPQALAAFWSMLKSNIPGSDKYDLAIAFDEILGLDLNKNIIQEISEEVKILMQKREALRKSGNFTEADKVRDEIIKLGYTVNDAASP